MRSTPHPLTKGIQMARKTRTTRKNTVTRLTPATALALARATAQKAIASLMKQGAALKAASREAAVEGAIAAKDAALARAEEAKAKTVEAVSHLEKVFEQRVSKAISKMG